MEENVLICQSCAMPMLDPAEQGTNADGSLNSEYCIYCYKGGEFVNNLTMEQMVEHNLEYLDEFNKESEVKFTKEEARKELLEFFPTLKRWRKV